MLNKLHNNCTEHLIRDFCLDEVVITDSYSLNAMKKEIEYLISLEPDKLIAGFYEMKGKKAKATKYPGWEKTEIKGHTLGHYLVAVAQAYLNTKSPELQTRLDYMMDELKKCQLENGFLFASDEEIFDRVENRKPAWVPWYNMHKILAGVIAVYQATGNQDALEVSSRLGDWVYQRASRWSNELQALVLSVEYGGMNDALYELYKVSGSHKHLEAAHKFDEISLFEAMRNKEDILDGRHANTTIPKILGALNRYMALGEDEKFYLEAAENFWDIVINHHTYITGGNSEWEHFGSGDQLDVERTNCNCETCNTYNMLKLSKGLFQVTGNKKYADFYERTHLNAIMASQNPETGMTTYFQPMAAGYFKVFGTPFDKFWCCTGTGMENFTKLNDGIYMHDEERIYVNRYISSKLNWLEKGISIHQDTAIPSTNHVTFHIDLADQLDKKEFTLALRIPDWINGNPSISLNDQHIVPDTLNGYAFIKRIWSNQDQVEVVMPIKVSYECLPDNPGAVAFSYGPVVLCASLGKEDMRIVQTGVAVDIPTKDMTMKDFVIINNGSVKDWLSDLEQNLIRTEGKLEFRLKGTDEDDRLIFTPYYQQYQERYGIYWEFVQMDSQELQSHIRQEKDKKRFDESIIDKIPVGNDQYELVHNIRGEHTEAGGIEGHRCRVIREHGWFSYQMKVVPASEYYLGVTYFRQDIGKVFNIYIDDELMLSDTLSDDSGQRFFSVEYQIPNHFLEGKKEAVIRYEHGDPITVNSIWDLFYLRKGYDSDTSIKSICVNGMELEKDNMYYIIPDVTREASFALQIIPTNPNALVYVDGILINDTQPREIVTARKREIEVVIEAENRLEQQLYRLKCQ